PNSYFGITRAVLHDVDESPKDELSQMAALFDGRSLEGLEGLSEQYGSMIGRSLSRWAAGKASDDDARWIGWLLKNRLLTNANDLTRRLHALLEEYRFAASRIAAPKVFNGVADLDAGYDFPVLPAGDASHPGKAVPRGFLQLITGTQEGFEVFGSG